MGKWTKTRLNKLANNIRKEKIVYVSRMGSSVHAQGPYKHLTPGNPGFKEGASSVFSATSSASGFLKSSVGSRWNESFGLGGEGNEEMGIFPSSRLHSLLRSSRFLSPRGAISVSLSLHHSADRRVRQVELARDVSGWVLLQRWRKMGREEEGTHITGSFCDKSSM